jgi:EAL domain-containing protein (putative c-di-GMP-specific phosphodiesterase class I)
LAYLRRLPVDFLKLDRVLVQDIDTDPQAARIAETVVVLAHTLGLPTIAEGIERPEQAEGLAAMGCQYGQGWLFGRPQPLEAKRDMIATSKQSCPALPQTACSTARLR